MASLTGAVQIFASDTSIIDTTLNHPLGTKARDENGNEYIYLTGIGSTAAGSWVFFDEAHITTLLTTASRGRVGVAMAAIDAATKYGWYQIYGKNTIAKSDTGETITDNSLAYTSGVPGAVDDTDVTLEMVIGAFIRSAATLNVITVELNYPMIIYAAID